MVDIDLNFDIILLYIKKLVDKESSLVAFFSELMMVKDQQTKLNEPHFVEDCLN